MKTKIVIECPWDPIEVAFTIINILESEECLWIGTRNHGELSERWYQHYKEQHLRSRKLIGNFWFTVNNLKMIRYSSYYMAVKPKVEARYEVINNILDIY